jgi:hypothetical protein
MAIFFVTIRDIEGCIIMKAFKLEYLANTNKPFEVTATPKASRYQTKLDDTGIRVYVTTDRPRYQRTVKLQLL